MGKTIRHFLDWEITVAFIGHDWHAEGGGIARKGDSFVEALERLKAGILWGRPTLPVLHMNGSGGLLRRGASDLAEALKLFSVAIRETPLPVPEASLFKSLVYHLEAYLGAHFQHFEGAVADEHPEGHSHELLSRCIDKTENFTCAPKQNTAEVRDFVKVFRSLEDALLAWEFNRRDYYPVEGLWECALKERRSLTQSVSRALDAFKRSRTLPIAYAARRLT